MTGMEEKSNVSVSEGTDSFETGTGGSFRSWRQGGSFSGSIGLSRNLDEAVVPPSGPQLDQMSRGSSPPISVAGVSTQDDENSTWQKDKDDDSTGGDNKTSPTKSTKMISFCRLISHRDFLDTVLMILGSIGAIGAGCSQPLLTLLFGHLVDVMNSNTPTSKFMDEVSAVCLKLLYTAIGAGFASILEMGGWTLTAERQISRIRRMYLKSLLRQDVGYFDQEIGVGEIMNKISGDMMLIHDALGDKVANVIELAARFFFGWGIGFFVNWRMAAVTVAAIPPIAIVGSLMALGLTKASRDAQDAYTEAGGIVEQVLGSIRTVSSNTGEKKAVDKYDEALNKAEKAGVRLGYFNGFGIGMVLCVTFATYGLAMWYGSRLVSKGQATAGEIINVIFSIVMGGSALGLVAPPVTGILAGLGAAYSMFQVIERNPSIDSDDLSGLVLPSVKGEIHLKNIEFSYPTRPEYLVFTNFDLLVTAGSTTALVGESGCGKSSVIQLIERFYDPQNGQVLLDGVDIKNLQLRWLRSQIALVSQEPMLFATSIRDNIMYGKHDATKEEVEGACVLANASLFIDRLPKGYDTLVGDRGTQLSGGQKQRIAIARAIVKNPRILLLDEATSALDAESEHMVQEALDRVSTGRTTVVVAHRLSTIKNANLIAVVRKGVVVETGVHDELIQRVDSAYSQLVRIQESRQVDGAFGDNESEISGDQMRMMSGKLDRLNDEGSFRKLGKDHSSRRLARKSISRRWSSSRLSFVSDLLSGSQPGSRHFDHAQVHDLLDNESDLVADDAPKRPMVKQKISYKRLIKMNLPELPFFFFGALGSVAVGAILPAFAFILYKAIAALLAASPEKVRNDGGFFASLFVALGGVHLICTPCEKVNFAYVGERLLRRLRLQSFEKIVRQEVAWFDEDSNSSAKLGARLLSDAAAVRSVTGETFSVIVQAISTLIVGFGIAFSGSWQLTLIVIGISPFLAMQGILNIGMEQALQQKEKDSLSQATQVASDAVSNIRTVASFGAEEKTVELYATKSTQDSRSNVRKGVVNGMVLGFANFSLFCGYGLSFYAGARLVQQGNLKAEEVFLVVLAISLSALSFAAAFRIAPDLRRSKPSILSIFGILDRVSKIDPMDDKGVILQNLRGRIEFNGVSFRYPTRPTVQVLQRLSFTLRAGKNLALVGGSGSGKSTVISLIERFYDPDSGMILIDGVEIQALNLRWLRQNIGLVSQEPVLFDDTIRGNILYGEGGKTSEDEMYEAARCANAHAFISALPDGYNTRVGERGIQLSGGQKQRVAIARAILRSPKILLLDEATSALDAESERIVQETLDRIMVRRSTVIVAHRLSTVRNCDEILVLSNGRIAEKGSYHDLMTSGGLFASLVRQSFNTPK